MSTIDTAIKTTIDNSYSMQIIWDEFDANHNYDFSNRKRYPLKESVTNINEAHDFITHYYLSGLNSLVAYQLFEKETVTETTVGSDIEGEVVTTHITITERTVETFFRTWEDYEAKVINYRKKRDAEDIASGRRALEDAAQEEMRANGLKRAAGLPTTSIAYNALQRFFDEQNGNKFPSVPSLEEEAAEARKLEKKNKKFFGLF
jgi:hypothetical protein